MKRYDNWRRAEHKVTHVTTTINPGRFTANDLKKLVANPDYTISVDCRRCGNLHDIDCACELCGLESKVTYKDYE
jgi:hypothetical protein